MEFKTCEEYVLSLLEENLNELTHQEEVIRSLNKKLGEVEEKYNTLKELIAKYCTYEHNDYSSDVLKFDYIFEAYGNRDDFYKLVELVPGVLKK